MIHQINRPMTDRITDEMVEAAARAICLDMGVNPDKMHVDMSLPKTAQGWQRYPVWVLRVSLARAALTAAVALMDAAPIPMVLHCPSCGLQHIDKPDPDNGWHDPDHRSHQCQGCGAIWRPADVPTKGAERIATRGKADTVPPVPRDG